jgi:hypothetical protein
MTHGSNYLCNGVVSLVKFDDLENIRVRIGYQTTYLDGYDEFDT